FPVPPGGFQPTLGGLPIAQTDGFVLGAPPSLQSWSFGTFVGGPTPEQLLAIDRDPVSGHLAVAGWAIESGYPTTPGVVRPSSGGDIDAVLTRLDATAATAVWSTYLGGVDEDAAQTVHFDVDGSVWIGGFTDSTNFPPTLNAPQTALAGGFDGFVTRVAANGQSLVFSTLLGGPGDDRVRALDLSVNGLMVVGEAAGGFPVTAGAPQQQFASGMLDAFATHLTNGGASIAWSSYFGGVGQESFAAVHFADSGIATLAGYSYSFDFPIAPAALQVQLLGVEDGTVVQLDLLSDLGPGLQVLPVSGESVEVVGPGEVELLRCDLANVTDRELFVDSMRVLVTGAGASSANVVDVRVLHDGVVVGTLPAATPGQEQVVALTGLTLPPRATAPLRMVATLVLPPLAASFEVAALVDGADAWQVRAFGLGNGPTVGVLGDGRATGPVAVVGSLPGDVDGSGRRTVVDVRRLVHAVGTGDNRADVDGDGAITPIDVAATREAILGRASGFAVPAQIARGGWLRLRALLPKATALQASLGGRSLTIGRVTPRELSMRVPADQPIGLQELEVTRGGRVVFVGLVEVL
ncbi:MAG: hypothetical protein KAI24_23270, partial [Planctomycetes bacterium]|nr:hypothetical protein [Planctomycetota bacterium]